VLGAAVVHVARADTLDVAVFLGTAVLMLVLLRHDRQPRTPPRWLSGRWAGPAAASVVGLVVAVQPRASLVVQLTLAAVGAAGVVVAVGWVLLGWVLLRVLAERTSAR